MTILNMDKAFLIDAGLLCFIFFVCQYTNKECDLWDGLYLGLYFFHFALCAKNTIFPEHSFNSGSLLIFSDVSFIKYSVPMTILTKQTGDIYDEVGLWPLLPCTVNTTWHMFDLLALFKIAAI